MDDRVIICKCGQWNRLKDQRSKTGYFSCANCGARLYDGNPHAGASGKRWGFLALALLAAVGVWFLYIGTVNTPHTRIAQNPSSSIGDFDEFHARHVLEQFAGDHEQARSRGGSVAPQAPKPTPQLQNQTTSIESQPKTQVPATTHGPKNELVPVKIGTGVIWRKGKGAGLARLTIEADAGNYAIKLMDGKSNNAVLMIFVGAHQTFATKVPSGTYKIFYASGSVWYGEEQLFGPATTYSALSALNKATMAPEEEFRFIEDGHRYTDLTIRMEKRPDGNLSNHPITPSEFNK
jgi:hypothetical protein